MTTRSPSPPPPPATDDYTYEMQVHVPVPQIIEALTDDTVIGRWWTAVTRSERDGDDVQLFMGGDGAPFVFFTVEHAPGDGRGHLDGDRLPGDGRLGRHQAVVLGAAERRRNLHRSRSATSGCSPALECFDQCRAGWNHFMPSLHQFLETGVGRPNEPREPVGLIVDAPSR